MDQAKAKQLVSELQKLCVDAYDIAKKALRSKKSLAGDNFYGNKFHTIDLEIAKLEVAIQPVLGMLPPDDKDLVVFKNSLQTIRSTSIKPPQKNEALRQINSVCKTKLIPHITSMTANPIPETEQVLPLAIINDGRLKKIAIQINGCYEHQWYDACSVLMRRFTETLIIDSYIEKAKADEIKDSNGDFFMLRDLVSKITNDSTWHLGRDTKKTLPLVKDLGDLSAHNRFYMATKKDIDKIAADFRTMIEELLYHAGYNKNAN